MHLWSPVLPAELNVVAVVVLLAISLALIFAGRMVIKGVAFIVAGLGAALIGSGVGSMLFGSAGSHNVYVSKIGPKFSSNYKAEKMTKDCVWTQYFTFSAVTCVWSPGFARFLQILPPAWEIAYASMFGRVDEHKGDLSILAQASRFGRGGNVTKVRIAYGKGDSGELC